MNILVIGKGGREHAIVRSLQCSPSAEKIYYFPGREGFKTKNFSEKPSHKNLNPFFPVKPAQSLLDTENSKKPSPLNNEKNSKSADQNLSSAESLIPLMKEKNIQLVIIGPEKELVCGWGDVFRSQGFKVFGPGQKASMLEGSKIFSKKFMESAGVPTARHFVVEGVKQTLESAVQFSPPYVLKADGLCAGKGVFICQNLKELKEKAKKLFEEKIFGPAGEKALLEEFQNGHELSLFILTNGKESTALPLAQDYKKLKEKSRGPNTGGMGAVAPKIISPLLMEKIQNKIVQPTLLQIQKQNLFYRGVLYIGLMIVEDEPFVLEYNVRFGDPECQALLPLIKEDTAKIFYETADGRLPQIAAVQNLYSCCVALAEKGYPDNPQKGAVILGDLKSKIKQAYFLHAGTKKSDSGGWIVDGGRVLNAIALDSSPQSARKRAYQLAGQVTNLSYRKDIGE